MAPQSSKANKQFGSLIVNGKSTLNEISINKTSITQGTSITTGVTIDSPCGYVQTVSTTLATQGQASFTVSNAYVDPSSIVIGNIINYGGNSGSPVAIIDDIRDEAFSINITNVAGAGALNGTISIGFLVI
jgi:hypothetical protein